MMLSIEVKETNYETNFVFAIGAGHCAVWGVQIFRGHGACEREKRIHAGGDSMGTTSAVCSTWGAVGGDRGESGGEERRLHGALENAGWISHSSTLASAAGERDCDLGNVQGGNGGHVRH